MEKRKNVYAVFVDLEKAFDKVERPKMMSVLSNNGIDWKERRLIANLYLKQRMKIKIGSDNSEPFFIGRGVRQGCCLSPTIFNDYLEEVIKESMEGTKGIIIGAKRIECIRFADDMILLADDEKTLQKMLNTLNQSRKLKYFLLKMTGTQRYLLYFSYMGTHFRGSQIQNRGDVINYEPTIQGCIETALSQFLKLKGDRPITVTMSRRCQILNNWSKLNDFRSL